MNKGLSVILLCVSLSLAACESAASLAKKGDDYSKSKQYKEAIEAYTKSIEKDPKSVQTYENRGYAFYKLRQYQDAINDYSTVIGLDGNNAKAYARRGYIRFHMFGKLVDKLLEEGKVREEKNDSLFLEANKDCEKSISLNPNLAESHICIGESSSGKGAIEHFNKAISLDPNNSEAYVGIAKAYLTKKDYSSAIFNATKAISLDSTLSDAFKCRGNAYLFTKKHKEAIANFSAAINLDPNNSRLYFTRGIAYSSDSIQKNSEAILDYTKSISLSPGFAVAYSNRGFLYEKLKQAEKAKEDYKKSCELGIKTDCTEEELRQASQLEMTDGNWDTEYGYATYEGSVKNISGEKLDSVAALVTWYDENDNMITSNESLIKFQPLMPDQESPFRVMVAENPAMNRAKVEFKYLMGESIPTYRKKK